MRPRTSGCSVSEVFHLRRSCSHRYPRQKLLVVALREYAYLVPYIEEADGYFLKTIIPSRKATRDYLRRSRH